MKTIAFTLSGRPKSKKNSRRLFIRGAARPTSLPSEAYEKFKNDCLLQLREIRIAGVIPDRAISEKVEVDTKFLIKGNYDIDGDNAHTGILDILQDAGVIVNDSQVVLGSYQKVGRQSEWATVVRITIL